MRNYDLFMYIRVQLHEQESVMILPVEQML